MMGVPVSDRSSIGPNVELAPISDKMFSLTNWPLAGMVMIREPVTAPLLVELPSRAVIPTEAGEELGFTMASVERKLALALDFKSKLTLPLLTLFSMLGSFVELSICVAKALIGELDVSFKYPCWLVTGAPLEPASRYRNMLLT